METRLKRLLEENVFVNIINWNGLSVDVTNKGNKSKIAYLAPEKV